MQQTWPYNARDHSARARCDAGAAILFPINSQPTVSCSQEANKTTTPSPPYLQEVIPVALQGERAARLRKPGRPAVAELPAVRLPRCIATCGVQHGHTARWQGNTHEPVVSQAALHAGSHVLRRE